jgi:hypothetical protein
MPQRAGPMLEVGVQMQMDLLNPSPRVEEVLTLSLTIRGSGGTQPILLVFLGYCLGWVSTTIARYAYPPPKRWGATRN